MKKSSIVYADCSLLVVNKAPGLSLATRRAEPEAAARRLLESLPEEARAAHELAPESVLLAHRLDVGT